MQLRAQTKEKEPKFCYDFGFNTKMIKEYNLVRDLR
jgi:hypothetical protein